MALATDISEGEIQLTGDLAGDGGAQIGSNPQLTHMPGLTAGQYINPKMTVDAKGRVSAITAATPAEIGATLPVASASQVGVVSIGDNINITSSPTQGSQGVDLGASYVGSPAPATGLASCGTYSVDIQVDGGTTYTVSNTGANLATLQDVIDQINADTTGVTATDNGGDILITSDTEGRGSKIDILNDSLFACMNNFVAIDAAVDGTDTCEIYVNQASDSQLGVVQIGSGIDVTDGVISVTLSSLPIATTTELGGVIVPTSGNIDIDGSGNISVPLATAGTVGVASFGSGLSVDVAGEVTLDLPIATDLVLGGVKEGTGVTIGVDGTLSADFSSLPIATNSVVGTVKVPGGDGLAVDGAGALTYTIPTATDSVVGGVYVPTSNGLSVAVDGQLTISLATNSTVGTVKSADTTHITIDGTGGIDVGTDVALKDVQNSFSKAQNVTADALTSGTSIAVDASLSNTFTLTLNHNATLSNPTNLVAGGTYVFIITQGSTGGTMAYGTSYKFPIGYAPPLTAATGAVDVLSCISDGTNLYCSMNKDFL